MKITVLWLGMVLAFIRCASGQVTVEVTQDQEQFLPGEALKAAVRITNLSGQALHLGAQPDWLTFSVESREGTVVPKLGEVPVQGAFVLESSKVAIKRVDLGPYFTTILPGRYQIVATVRIQDWGNREITSAARQFDVIDGAKLWEQEVGVPKPAGAADGEPELRRYALQQANYIRGELRLYLRVTDQYGKPVRVFPLGPVVSFGRPQEQIDRLSNLHVLFQDGASSFRYVVCNLQGDIVQRQTFDYALSRPRLRLDGDGNIAVVGGARRVTANDVPAPAQDNDDTLSPPLLPPSASAATNQLSGAPKP